MRDDKMLVVGFIVLTVFAAVALTELCGWVWRSVSVWIKGLLRARMDRLEEAADVARLDARLAELDLLEAHTDALLRKADELIAKAERIKEFENNGPDIGVEIPEEPY